MYVISDQNPLPQWIQKNFNENNVWDSFAEPMTLGMGANGFTNQIVVIDLDSVRGRQEAIRFVKDFAPKLDAITSVWCVGSDLYRRSIDSLENPKAITMAPEQVADRLAKHRK